MPTRKTARRSRKRVHKKKVPSNKQLSTRIKKLEHSEELKYFDVVNTLTPPTGAGTAYCLNQIAQGDDIDERLGEEITCKYLNIRYRIRHLANLSADEVRVVLLWDKQTNGLGPVNLTSVSLAQGVFDNSIITNTSLMPLNYRCKDRYTILYDKVSVMNADSTGVNMTKIGKIKCSLGGCKLKYSATSSLLADIPSRSLFVLIFMQNGDATTSFTLASRLWYTDS